MILAGPSLKVADHPLVRQLLTRLRNDQTPTSEFRESAYQLSRFLVYEAMDDLNIRTVEVKTPVGQASGVVLSDYVILAPVLRAGLILSEAAQELFPSARIYHIGLKRDEETLQANFYYRKLPDVLPTESRVYILDPMLATGGSAQAAISLFAELKVSTICLVCFVAAPEGLKRVHDNFPNVRIVTAAVDEHLNEHGYIIPGLGDAGDRLFGT